jgi:hypothetical protein
MQPDDNDIVYTTYGLDFEAIFKSLYDAVMGNNLSYDSVSSLLIQIWTIYSFIAFAISAILIIGIIYAYLKINEFDEILAEDLLEKEKIWKEVHDGHIENERWANVQEHLNSQNPNDWKLAIIEADVLLERMLNKAGYVGETIGDKLKNASGRSFQTLDDAWQAHRVRNQIAHGGADFILTHKIAQDTLILYERVFKEFDVV